MVWFKAHPSFQTEPCFQPIADFFFPSFNWDICLYPVGTLKAYKSQTLHFRDMDTNTPHTNLFLSWIAPVSSSSNTACWLCICLLEASINTILYNTTLFKPNLIRSISCSSAVWAGIFVSDILKAAD